MSKANDLRRIQEAYDGFDGDIESHLRDAKKGMSPDDRATYDAEEKFDEWFMSKYGNDPEVMPMAGKMREAFVAGLTSR